jgi:hypothetical protein
MMMREIVPADIFRSGDSVYVDSSKKRYEITSAEKDFRCILDGGDEWSVLHIYLKPDSGEVKDVKLDYNGVNKLIYNVPFIGKRIAKHRIKRILKESNEN